MKLIHFLAISLFILIGSSSAVNQQQLDFISTYSGLNATSYVYSSNILNSYNLMETDLQNAYENLLSSAESSFQDFTTSLILNASNSQANEIVDRLLTDQSIFFTSPFTDYLAWNSSNLFEYYDLIIQAWYQNSLQMLTAVIYNTPLMLYNYTNISPDMASASMDFINTAMGSYYKSMPLYLSYYHSPISINLPMLQGSDNYFFYYSYQNVKDFANSLQLNNTLCTTDINIVTNSTSFKSTKQYILNPLTLINNVAGLSLSGNPLVNLDTPFASLKTKSWKPLYDAYVKYYTGVSIKSSEYGTVFTVINTQEELDNIVTGLISLLSPISHYKTLENYFIITKGCAASPLFSIPLLARLVPFLEPTDNVTTAFLKAVSNGSKTMTANIGQFPCFCVKDAADSGFSSFPGYKGWTPLNYQPNSTFELTLNKSSILGIEMNQLSSMNISTTDIDNYAHFRISFISDTLSSFLKHTATPSSYSDIIWETYIRNSKFKPYEARSDAYKYFMRLNELYGDFLSSSAQNLYGVISNYPNFISSIGLAEFSDSSLISVPTTPLVSTPTYTQKLENISDFLHNCSSYTNNSLICIPALENYRFRNAIYYNNSTIYAHSFSSLLHSMTSFGWQLLNPITYSQQYNNTPQVAVLPHLSEVNPFLEAYVSPRPPFFYEVCKNDSKAIIISSLEDSSVAFSLFKHFVMDWSNLCARYKNSNMSDAHYITIIADKDYDSIITDIYQLLSYYDMQDYIMSLDNNTACSPFFNPFNLYVISWQPWGENLLNINNNQNINLLNGVIKLNASLVTPFCITKKGFTPQNYASNMYSFVYKLTERNLSDHGYSPLIPTKAKETYAAVPRSETKNKIITIVCSIIGVMCIIGAFWVAWNILKGHKSARKESKT